MFLEQGYNQRLTDPHARCKIQTESPYQMILIHSRQQVTAISKSAINLSSPDICHIVVNICVRDFPFYAKKNWAALSIFWNLTSPI